MELDELVSETKVEDEDELDDDELVSDTAVELELDDELDEEELVSDATVEDELEEMDELVSDAAVELELVVNIAVDSDDDELDELAASPCCWPTQRALTSV